MDKAQYKLNCTLIGHSGDVRALAFFADGTLVSTSRDKTIRVWRPSRDGKEYRDGEVLKGHKKFVSAVCVLNPSTNHPNGIIITGGNDHNITIYILGETEPRNVIKAHKDTICNLRTSVQEGIYFSSSWDMTAKMWSIESPEEPKLVLRGHTRSVWCVADHPSGVIVTGGADNLVIIWSRDGSILHKLEGHTDCVRDIAILKEDKFLTCANDLSVKHWSAISGDCLGTYYGHGHYIYGISILPNDTTVATCSEDKSVIIWENGENRQTLKFPARTVWCVKFLPNTDIAAGTSDGIIRIFSCDPNRQASPEILEIYDKCIEEDECAPEELDEIPCQTLPGAAALDVPGQADGESLMVNIDGKPVVYTWSGESRTWIKIGHVLGTSRRNRAASSRQVYEGNEYDYVFSIDIQDGVPPLKLPYNKNEDAWHAAQQFIYKHGLSQTFLDQIANFIIKNSGGSSVTAASSDYADPLTGENRYIPGSGMPNASRSGPSVTNPDPFTGSVASLKRPIRNLSYIPHNCHLKLEQANTNVILDKLKEFNSQINGNLSEASLTSVVTLVKEGAYDEKAINVLWKMLFDWPPEYAFPVLDIARLAVLYKYPNQQLCSEKLLAIIQRHLTTDALVANQMLTFRLLANMFVQETGEKFGLTHSDEFLNAVIELSSFGSKHNQVAISTYMLNLSVSRCEKHDEPNKRKILSIIISILPKFKEIEAIFRTLVALGTLIAETVPSNDREELVNILKHSESTVKQLQTMANTKSMNDPHGKVAKCSTEILALIV